MSTGFGHNKGKDGKYNTLNPTSYKGRSVDSTKHSGNTLRHGLQSLGKVAATRRVPPPANLPSLKSENLGNDPNVNLVPKDGSGWASKPEAPNQQQAPQTTQLVLPQRQASATYAQPSASPTTFNNQNLSSQSNGPPQATWGPPSRYSQAGNKISGAVGGAPVPGTTHFSEDFPTLGSESKEHQNVHGVKSKEQQYGPGPSLRPQNVASWRGGGGQNLNVKDSYSSSENSKSAMPDSTLQSSNSTAYETNQGTDSSLGRPPIHQSVAPNVLPQNYPGQYRPGMIPQFMYSNRFPHGMPPPGPNFRYPPMVANMRYPPYPNDQRFRTMMNQPMLNQAQESGSVQPAISSSELQDFDKAEKDEDSGWAGMHAEVDYSEKLVFSDEEDKENHSREKEKSSAGDEYEGKPERRHKESPSGHPQQSYGSFDPSIQQYYYMYGPGQQQMDYRNKSPVHYDKRMLPPNPNMYAGGRPMHHHHHPYAPHPGAIGSSSFPASMSNQSHDRFSPRGDEDHWKKNEKEEALERARKRREEEEKRMEKQRRSSTEDSGYYHPDSKRVVSHPRRSTNPDEDPQSWSNDHLPSHNDRHFYTRRTESESSDDKKLLRDRVPGDGYGGTRQHPRPSAGGISGRNLPPRLANQRQKQIESRPVGPSIMKRERVESEGSETYESRTRKPSELSSMLPTGGQVSVEEKRIHMGRDFIRKDERKHDDKRITENISPSTTNSDREPRLWDAGSSKRSSIKRQSSRDSPVSIGSSGDARLSSQKTLLSRNDSKNKPVTRCGSNQSNQSLDREDVRQPAMQSRRTMSQKVKLTTFRVEASDDEDGNQFRKPSSHKFGKSNESKLSGKKEHVLSDTQSSWKQETKAPKPIATVTPTATTTTSASRDSQANFNITRITRDVGDVETSLRSYDVSLDNRRGEPSADYNEGTTSNSAWRDVAPDTVSYQDNWDQDNDETSGLPAIRESQRNKDYRNKNKGRSDPRHNRNTHDASDRGSHRYPVKEYRNNDRVSGESRGDPAEGRDDNRGANRRYRNDRNGDSNRYRGSRNDNDRYNRNRKEPREVRRDSKPNQSEASANQTSHTQKPSSTKSQTLKQPSDKPLFSSSKPTAAAAPVTNIWEERKKQQLIQQTEVKKNIYIPTEDDKKRTLKETAPNPRQNEEPPKPIKDERNQSNLKKSRDSNLSNRNQYNDSRSRQSSSLPEKRFYEVKQSVRSNSGRRGASSARQSSRPERKSSSTNFPPSEFTEQRDHRSSMRGRGRSRGSLMRGSGRGRGQAGFDRPPSSRNLNHRGRSTASYKTYTHNSREGAGRGRSNSRKFEETDSPDDESYESESEALGVPRRRRVGEGSEASFSTDASYSDNEAYNSNQSRTKDSTSKNRSRVSRSSGPHYKTPSYGKSRSSNQTSTFAASGAPTRRGRGRGATASTGVVRGRGRGMSRNSAPPSRNYNSEERGESKNRPKNSDRDLQEGADNRRMNDRRRKPKQDRPPRFSKNPTKSQTSYRKEGNPLLDDIAPIRDETSPTGDGGATQSSDVGNDEWETASDNSNDARKTPLHPQNKDAKKSEPKRSFSNQRPPPSNRNRGGRNAPSSERMHSIKKNIGKIDNQVYTIHTVNYSNPSAIEGAIRDATTTSEEAKIKKQEEAQKIKHEDLFRMYDLNNYAGVVNVDDLPDLPAAQRKNQPATNVTRDLVVAVQDSTETTTKATKSEKSDDFTTVLSKKALRKRQEESRKKDEDQMNEAVRKAKLEQQQQNRRKFFNKNSTTAIASGSSGSMKQSVPTTINESNLWSTLSSTLDSWVPQKELKEQLDSTKDASVSQHDSGVESSAVPSSQRSSPGTEAKLSFSHFGATFTPTSVITSICNDQVSASPEKLQKMVRNYELSEIMSLTRSDGEANEASHSSPSRSASGLIGPIGNERIKTSKPNSIENIATLFPSMDDKNSISFIADDAKENSTLSSNEIRCDTFSSSFGDSLDPSLNEIKYTNFSTDNFFSDKGPGERNLTSFSVSNFPKSLSNSTSVTSALPSDRSLLVSSSRTHAVNHSPYIHPTSVTSKFSDGLSMHSNNQTIQSISNTGVKSDSEKPTDMTLSPQTSANDNVDHTGRSLEGSSVPGPIPLPPKHSAVNAQRPDGDSQSESRQLREVNANANGAGDMGLMTPTSPSVDFNLKMESARKAWENLVSEASIPATQQSHTEATETYSYHQSASAGGTEHLQTEPSNLSSVSLSVTNSSEWKPRQTAGTVTAPSEPDESWRSNISQQNPTPNPNTIPQVTQTFNKKSIVTSADEPSSTMSNSGFSVESPGSVPITQSQHLKQTPAQTYSSSGGMILNRPSPYDPLHRMPAQASHSALFQTISSSSLASNLHNMQQQQTYTFPLDYPQNLYSAAAPTGYSNLTQHPSYGNVQRDYNQQVVFTTSTVATSAVKQIPQSTIAVKPVQPPTQALREGGLPAAYIGTSVQGLEPQTNLGSTQLGIHRPHGGVSPAQPSITYIASPTVPGINSIAPPQMPHSTSFYSQLNQSGSSYYGQPQHSQIRQQQTYTQTLVAPQAASFPQGLNFDSIWPLGSMQQNPYPPIAPPTQQRLRNDSDYQGYPFYQTKNVFGPTANKFVPSSSQGPGSFGPIKSNIPASGYDVMKSPPMYSPKVSTPGNLDHQASKYPASSPNKPFNSQTIPGTDWNKSVSAQQYKANSVQGLLSRPYSSGADGAFQQSSPAASISSYFHPKPDMSMPVQMNFPHQPPALQPFNSLQSGWGQTKPQAAQGLMGVQPPTAVIHKGVRPAITSSPILGRLAMPQNFQQTGLPSSQVPVVPRPSMPYSVKSRPGGGVRLSSPISSDNALNKSSQSSQANKVPPLPTLVRGSGSNLAGKKPTFMPEEVVKSNQASERASLLQSLSAFFPDKEKSGESNETSQDWSTQVANSSPLPKRKPGLRHPGIERRRPGKDAKSGPLGSTKNIKRLQPKVKKEEIPPSESAESIVRPVKKMTLADTKPKKGEVAKIQLG